MKVFITGGTGFFGMHLVAELQRRGHEIIALVRRPAQLEGVQEILGDIASPQTLDPNRLRGCGAAFHLVAIIREFPARGITYQKVHLEGTQNVLRACQQAGINRFFHMSALGADLNSRAAYLRTKAQMEEMIKASGLDRTIFRPAVILGRGGELTQTLQKLTALPLTPLMGDGSFIMEPVAVSTVAQAFANALEKPETIGKTYELRGEAITYRDLLARIAQMQDRKARFISAPLSLIRFQASLLDRFSWFPVSREQIIMLEEYQASADRTAYAELGVGFKSIDEVLEEATKVA
ncbi:MAG TPA: complex I NDUFA9 subunit family protein [bacterium]|jgi:NADH dehydrogenase